MSRTVRKGLVHLVNCLWWDTHGVLILSFLVGRTWSPDFVFCLLLWSPQFGKGFDAPCFLAMCLVERLFVVVPLGVGRQALHLPSLAATSS